MQRPVSAASLAVFRISFGVAVAVNALLFLPQLVHRYYIEPTFAVSYGPFGDVVALPGIWMYLVYLAMVVMGVLIALGRWYRSAIAVFFVLTTYVFLLDATFFQNHEYLISLLALLLFFIPADAMWSLDTRRVSSGASPTVPVWTVWILRFQVGVPYFFGGVAKLNPDWLAGEPLRTWLGRRTDVEPMASIMANSTFVWFAVFGAIVIDLLAVPLLSWRRTRLTTYGVLVGFHLVNAWTFGLYVFPWLMIAATTIFFAPDWPLELIARWRRPHRAAIDPAARESMPVAGDGMAVTAPWRARLLAGFLASWIVVQLVVPLRPLLIDSNPSWSEEGHQFSWHMMLRQKTGTVAFELSDGRRRWSVDPRDHLSADQLPDVATQPAHLVQFAYHLSERFDGASVFAETSVSLNGRRPQQIVDPTLDLTTVPTMWFGRADWITPLHEPLSE